ncbi:hypothetical protein NN561_019461 [Cricetulus griseus]
MDGNGARLSSSDRNFAGISGRPTSSWLHVARATRFRSSLARCKSRSRFPVTAAQSQHSSLPVGFSTPILQTSGYGQVAPRLQVSGCR